MNDHVTVVTLTRDRPGLLRRAMESVAAQRDVAVRHVVVGDACPWLGDEAFVRQLRADFPQALVIDVARTPESAATYLPARLGALRNFGIARDDGVFVAQLDDDNTFQPDHLASLRRALDDAPHAGAAHSWRTLHLPDGTPFVPDGEDPWHPDPRLRAESYQLLVKDGVFEPGSAVVRDVFAVGGRVVARVDTSEFLVRREVVERVGYPADFSRARQRLQWTEDYVFALELSRAGVEVVCSRRATLDYRMGGYSNREALPATLEGAGT